MSFAHTASKIQDRSKTCLRAMRVTVRTIGGIIASGASPKEILAVYLYLEAEDINGSVL